MRAELQIPVQVRRHIRAILTTLAVTIVIAELGGIWNELRLVRREQVKNALYSIPDGRRTIVGKTPLGRRLENTVNVNGSVEIEGDVKVDEPVQVEIVR